MKLILSGSLTRQDNIKMKKELIKYFKSLGIEVYTNTKARGHQGFFLKNRIDVSKNTKEERIIPTLLHEFAHYIHNKLEPEIIKKGGSLDVLFNLSSEFDSCELVQIEQELLLVTNFVDKNSVMTKLINHKEQIRKKIGLFEAEIKKDYPKFMRSKKFKEFDRYIKKTNAKYLLKYDRVKCISSNVFGLFKKEEFYSTDTVEKDFPDMPRAFYACLRLKSAQRKQARNSARINRLNRYYNKPTELFARLVEGLYIDEAQARVLAPHATQRFFALLDSGYYLELKKALDICKKSLIEAGVQVF